MVKKNEGLCEGCVTIFMNNISSLKALQLFFLKLSSKHFVHLIVLLPLEAWTGDCHKGQDGLHNVEENTPKTPAIALTRPLSVKNL